MNNKALLESAANFFKTSYPGVTAEAVVCFLVFIDLPSLVTVGSLAQEVHMAELDVYNHLTLLAAGGAGLLSLENTGGDDTIISLTDEGYAAKDNLMASVATA
ncbi:hypothetical protein [Kordiimonas pumila]|uniref:Uncharacterized protein n=1 Tax=Kordiimonas pumila TaxID=2161677 RepID=A0ABV7D421_9PROT|nr:hypothetical protein [Kordiimonas pumila]